MTVARPCADLAPPRYQLPAYILLLVLALATMLGSFYATSAMRPAWLTVVQGACFMTFGASWIVWPNGKILSPLAIRLVGALMVATGLFFLVELFLHHLV